MENSKKGIESTRNLINGFEKRYGKILPLNYQQIKKDVKESDVWTDGGSVFVGLSVESGVDGDNLKVGQVNPNNAYITFSSHINKNGVGDGEKPDVARTYSIHLEISGRKRYTQRTYADGTYYKVVNYGRTINDLLDKIKEGMEGLLILDSITPVLKLTYQGSNFKKGGRFDGVKPEYKALFKKYLKQEGGNQHTENALMIVKQFGTEKENERMVEIKNIHEKEGHLPYELYTERYEISQPHYGKMFYAKGGSTYAKGGAIEERVYAIDMRADMYEGEGFFTYNQFKRYADELSDDEFMDEAETQGLVWSSMDGYIMWNDTSEKVGVDNLVKRKIPVKMMVADEYVNPMLREEEEENGSDDLVDGLIEKLKNADLDGETLQYVLEKIGMDYQMYKQLNVKYDNEDEESELQKEGILKSIGGNKYKYKDFEFAVEDGQLDMTEPDYYEGQEIENDKPTLDEVKSVIADYFDFDNRDMTAFPLEKSESELITKNFNDREQKEIFGNTFAKGGSTSSFSKEDVMTVAQRLKLNPNKEQVKYVLDNMESQADSDPTGNWQTHIEDLLYEQGLNVFALYEQGVNNYAKGGYVWVEKDNIMELGDFEEDAEVSFMSSREVFKGIDEWNDQLDTNYTTIKEFNDGEEYRKIMTIKEFEVYKKDWIKDNTEFERPLNTYEKGGSVKEYYVSFDVGSDDWGTNIEAENKSEAEKKAIELFREQNPNSSSYDVENIKVENYAKGGKIKSPLNVYIQLEKESQYVKKGEDIGIRYIMIGKQDKKGFSGWISDYVGGGEFQDFYFADGEDVEKDLYERKDGDYDNDDSEEEFIKRKGIDFFTEIEKTMEDEGIGWDDNYNPILKKSPPHPDVLAFQMNNSDEERPWLIPINVGNTIFKPHETDKGQYGKGGEIYKITHEESVSSLKGKLKMLDKDGNLTYPEKSGNFQGWGYEDYANDIYRDGFKSEKEAYKDAIAYLSEGKVPNKEQTREIANELIREYKKMSKLSPSKKKKADKWELNEETLESGSFDIDLNEFMGDGGSYYISGDQVILASVTPQIPVYNWVEKASKGALLKAKEEELKK